MKNNTINDIGEHELLKLIRKRWGKSAAGLSIGMGDDAAVFELGPGHFGLATCDLLIENVHFERKWISPKQLGHKSLAVNLSDIAAMGGTPRFALLSIALPAQLPVSWVEEFYQGLEELADKYGVVIAGGDTCASTKNIVINITLLGDVKEQELLLRSKAKIGDKIVVTGNLGDSAAGLAILQANQVKQEDTPLINSQLQPNPRCKEARAIAISGLATAMLDLSDGLATDIINLTKMSQVGAKIWLDQLPVSSYLKKRAPSLNMSAQDFAACGGEDYELLLTAPATAVPTLQKALANYNCSLTIIGDIVHQKEGAQLLDSNNNAKPWPKGYQHFQCK